MEKIKFIKRKQDNSSPKKKRTIADRLIDESIENISKAMKEIFDKRINK